MSNATELLKEICTDLECDSKLPMWLRDKVRAFLDAEPEVEPVAWGYKDRSGEISACISRQLAEDAGTQGDYKIPLYTRPEPTRNPLTDEEITDEFGIPRSGAYFIEGVFAGVRFAEKHHGIIPRCENS